MHTRAVVIPRTKLLLPSGKPGMLLRRVKDAEPELGKQPANSPDNTRVGQQRLAWQTADRQWNEPDGFVSLGFRRVDGRVLGSAFS